MPKSLNPYFFFFISTFFLGLSPIFNLQAQETIITGKVTDGETGEPLPYVQVGFQFTSTVSLTDEAGFYKINTISPKDSLTASALGYQALSLPVTPGIKQTLNFALKPNVISRSVIILYKDEPEIRLMKRVVKNKPQNRKDNLEAYEYEVYEKIKIGDIDYEKTRDKFFIPKAFKFFFTNIDTLNKTEYLPLFIAETVKKVWYKEKPKNEKEVITSVKMSGFKNESLSRIFSDRTLSAYIYDDYINFFNKNFISPISNRCLNHYTFKIEDSLWIDDEYCIKISFKPRHKQELAFTGTMLIVDSLYAVKSIEAKLAKDANINFITDISFRQEYEEVDQHVWMIKKEEYYIYGKISAPPFGNRHFLGTKTATYKDFIINDPKENSFYSDYGNYQFSKDSIANTDWDTTRHIPLTKNDETLYLYTDSLKNMRLFKNLLVLFTGYQNYKGWQVGPYFSLYSYNPVEGNRFRLGLRSTPDWSDKWLIETYGAYGTRDKQFKYGLGVQYFFKKMPRNHIGFYFSEDIEQFTWSQNYYRNKENALSTLFKVSSDNQLIRHNEFKLYYAKEWKEGLMNKLLFRRSGMYPLQDLKFIKTTEGFPEVLPNITTSEIALITHWGYKEKYLVGEYKRRSLGTNYPVFDLILIKGLNNVLGSDYDYSKIILSINHRLRLGIFGHMRYRLEGGKTWGSVPYPLLELHNGNQTIFFDELSFNTMNFFEFASDQYATLSVQHFFEGYLFNKIPLIRKLKWREVVSGKVLVGSLDQRHRNLLEMPAGLTGLTEPYGEAGFGIDNIFRFIRIDFLWRLNYLDKPNIDRFKIMGSLHVSF